jgi:hypothetical protein
MKKQSVNTHFGIRRFFKDNNFKLCSIGTVQDYASSLGKQEESLDNIYYIINKNWANFARFAIRQNKFA